MLSSHVVVPAGCLFFQPVLKLMFPLLFLDVDRRPNSVKVATVTEPSNRARRRICVRVFDGGSRRRLKMKKYRTKLHATCHNIGDMMVLLVGHRTCNHRSQVWLLVRCHHRSGLGQATYTCVLMSPSSIIWYWPRRVISLAGKVTVGLVGSNGSLPSDWWLMSPAGWLPRNQDQLRVQRS